jgi:hypothetical protein
MPGSVVMMSPIAQFGASRWLSLSGMIDGVTASII